MACNDYIVLESCIYRILQKHFAGQECYTQLLTIFHEVSWLGLQPCLGSFTHRLPPSSARPLRLAV